jgi:hypothetical protein
MISKTYSDRIRPYPKSALVSAAFVPIRSLKQERLGCHPTPAAFVSSKVGGSGESVVEAQQYAKEVKLAIQ